MPFTIVRNDITRMPVDAIVNAANSALAPGGGVCGAIFAAAGYEELNRACRKLGGCPTGQAVITPGFQLPAQYVIHTVGPVWQGGGHGEAGLLESCYRTSLQLAEKQGCRSVAFPLISSGIYGYPKREALEIAVSAIGAFLRDHELEVYLVVFDRSAVTLTQQRLGSIQAYIDDHYAEQVQAAQSQRMPEQAPMAAAPRPRSLKDLVANLEESFSKRLLRLIDQRGMTDVEVYHRANLDRKLFSKIRKEGYQPSKPTAIALAIALELSLDETRDLLAKAGYALSHSNKFDVIVEYFIQAGIYDIYEINEALFAFDQRLLGA